MPGLLASTSPARCAAEGRLQLDSPITKKGNAPVKPQRRPLSAPLRPRACTERRACTGAATVISCLAAGPHQSGGSIWEVDRDANKALFDEAARAGAQHFVLVATAEGREARRSSTLSE